jgi:predicted DNA-binding transcriptional regulator AlpA
MNAAARARSGAPGRKKREPRPYDPAAQLFIVKNAALFLGFSRARFYQLRATAGFPAPVQLPGPNADPMYRREDLEAWVRSLAAKETMA